MSTLHTMSVSFRLDELSEEQQLQVIRFVNHAAAIDSCTSEYMFEQLAKTLKGVQTLSK